MLYVPIKGFRDQSAISSVSIGIQSGPRTGVQNRSDDPFYMTTDSNIRAMPNRVQTFAFSGWLYRKRNAVERFFSKLKRFRAISARYDKRDDNYLASVQLASIRIWLRTYESVI